MKRIDKEHMAELAVGERVKGQAEVELGFTDAQVANETARCLECGCTAYFDCDLRKYATDIRRRYREVRGGYTEIQGGREPPSHHARPQQVHQLRPVRQDLLRDTAHIRPRLRQQGLQVRRQAVHGEIPLARRTASPAATASPPARQGPLRRSCPFRKPGPWAFEEKESVCTFCSVGLRPQLPRLRRRSFHRLERRTGRPTTRDTSAPRGGSATGT